MPVCHPADSTHSPCFRLWAILNRTFCCHCVLDPIVTAACQAYIHFLNQTWSGVCMTSRSCDVELQSDKCSACRGNSLLSRTSNTRPFRMKNVGLQWVTDPFPERNLQLLIQIKSWLRNAPEILQPKSPKSKRLPRVPSQYHIYIRSILFD